MVRPKLGSIAQLETHPTQNDLLQVASAIASNRLPQETAQWLVDVTALAAASGDAGTSTQAALVRQLVLQPRAGYRVEPVRYDGSHYRYARQLTLGLIGRADLVIEDAVVHAGYGDVLVTLDDTQTSYLPPLWQARGIMVIAAEEALKTGT
jgi:hypothetical protein